MSSTTHGNTAHFSQYLLQSTGDCLRDYPITIQQILQRHRGVMSFFPPNVLGSCNEFVVQRQALSFKPRIDLVLSMYKCNFSLLISKQGSKESFEIALFSAVLQPCSFSPPQVLCLHSLSVFG